MKRLGKFTGKVYEEVYDFSKCHECCRQISDEQATDDDLVRNLHFEDLKDCIRCFGCPAAQGNKGYTI